MATNNEPRKDDRPGESRALVPVYSPLDVTRGIEAYRRGDVILYTVRGEPREVQALIGELDRRGVREVVALVSHQAVEGEPQEPPPGENQESRERSADEEDEPKG